MKAQRLWNLIRVTLTFLFLLFIWVMFTSRLTLSSVLIGAAGSAVISLITFRLFIPSHQAALRYIVIHPLYLLLYLFMMIWFLYQSSFHVMKAIVLNRESPRIVHFRTRLRSDVGRMILALSITLTPGTICLDLNDDHLTVHWFTCDTTHSKEAGEKIKGKLEALIGRMLA